MMALSLSAYWVKFFKGAGFPQDVATKHAVVFSNNRIKPDMLPDLDKPSLKEMGITLMGDMIAILRYAKKVVEETTCERFLVDTEDPDKPSNVAKPIIKKVVSKVPGKPSVPGKLKIESITAIKPIKTLPAPTVKSVASKKVLSITRNIASETESKKRQVSLKRKAEETNDLSVSTDGEWEVTTKKKLKAPVEINDDKLDYTIVVPKTSSVRTPQILKKSADQKRTVFDRLGDSSVTSTTNLETIPTFNITGLGKEIFKRPASVFNRLGDKDAKKEEIPQPSILKNGISNTGSQGILKNWSTNTGKSITTKKIATKPVGTMRADHEVRLKSTSKTKQLLRNEKITFNNVLLSNTRIMKTNVSSSKLASERLAIVPAKARLGMTNSKQVTFNRFATVAHLKKPDVFSRLGI